MTIIIFVLKGDLNGKIVVMCFFFCRVYISRHPSSNKLIQGYMVLTLIQIVRIKIRPEILPGLIWVHTVCKYVDMKLAHCQTVCIPNRSDILIGNIQYNIIFLKI